MKIVAVIPAHMSSVRFPGKILFPIHGLPMIEHVRRRALLSKSLSEVIVATCDEEISHVIRAYGGKVVMTANTHTNGTTRVAEAVRGIDCSHVMLIQGDEPLLIPKHIDTVARSIAECPLGDAWNATGPIEVAPELDQHSFVKCVESNSGRVMHCFRRSPATCSAEAQFKIIRKILGLIAYRRDYLFHLVDLSATTIETSEFIEQMRILQNDGFLRSVHVYPSLPSVNEPQDIDSVYEFMKNNSDQEALLSGILSNF